jgi:hypothetical protein
VRLPSRGLRPNWLVSRKARKSKTLDSDKKRTLASTVSTPINSKTVSTFEQTNSGVSVRLDHVYNLRR